MPLQRERGKEKGVKSVSARKPVGREKGDKSVCFPLSIKKTLSLFKPSLLAVPTGVQWVKDVNETK